MQKWAEEFYSSGAWKAVREQAKKRDHYLCVNVNDPRISLNLNNLKSLCRECHKRYDPKRIPKRYKVDAFGRVVSSNDN